ncbi:MAG: glutaminyl-peptide cyclotransferase [Candidatus Bathyarchaeota archaeon]|nr:glutaminyl-peptide cyclotransferase [Candidatus Bathyarchaeota archaeon]
MKIFNRMYKMVNNILKKQLQTTILILIIAVTSSVIVFVILNGTSQQTPVNYTYEILESYSHDQTAFTQGLEFDNGFLFEGTGLYNQSTLRKVELETGTVLESISLPEQYFGEGITIFNNRIIQLTWRSQKGFVYEKDSFELLSDFSYPTEGWGITNDGFQLIMSDGTSTLFFLNPETYETVKQIDVVDQEPVTNLNELEYIQGRIYANIFQQDKIAIINPQTGKVEAWLDLTEISKEDTQNPNNVLNGIAYDSEKDRLFITGKRWSKLFQIELIKLD